MWNSLVVHCHFSGDLTPLACNQQLPHLPLHRQNKLCKYSRIIILQIVSGAKLVVVAARPTPHDSWSQADRLSTIILLQPLNSVAPLAIYLSDNEQWCMFLLYYLTRAKLKHLVGDRLGIRIKRLRNHTEPSAALRWQLELEVVQTRSAKWC